MARPIGHHRTASWRADFGRTLCAGCVITSKRVKMNTVRDQRRPQNVIQIAFRWRADVGPTLCSGPEIIKPFSCSTELSTKFILLINVKMPTIVGILTFISMINTTSERLKSRFFFICRYISFYEQLKFCAQLS